MTDLLNYTLNGSLTSFPEAINYTNVVLQQTSLGQPSLLGMTILALSFIGFLAVSSRFTSDRALPYSLFMTTIVAVLLTSASLLEPMFIIIPIVLLAIVLYFGGIEQ